MKNIITVALCFIISLVNAKENQTVIYLNFNNQVVSKLEDADYTRIIEKLDTKKKSYYVSEFYKNGTPKKFGNVKTIIPFLVYNGEVTSFYLNGVKASLENYQNNKLIGNSFYFHPNGNLKEQRFYIENTILTAETIYQVVKFADLNGKNLLNENATGEISITHENGDIETGKFVNGYKDGLWKSFDAKKQENYEDTYQDRAFVKGKTITANGNVTEYNKLFQNPLININDFNFRSFVRNSVLSQDINPWGYASYGGRVLVQFTVDVDGVIKNINVLNSNHRPVDSKDVKYFGNYDREWVPAQFRGKAIKSTNVILL